MDQLESMRMFVRIAEAGGFAKAASRVSVSTAAVSRALTDLEARLKVRLVNRTTRQISLTETGTRYLQHCRQILAHVDIANAEAEGTRNQPSGTLRIHAMTSLGQHYLAPLIPRYTQLFPDVSVELVLALRVPDLIEEQFDISVIAASHLADSSMVSQCLGSTRSVLCASPQYLSRQGMPMSPPDLERHICLSPAVQDALSGSWVFDDPDGAMFRPPRRAPFTVNDAEALAEAIRAGLGIGRLPLSTALQGIRDGSLVQVLPGSPLQPYNIYALYASREFLDSKIRTFVDFLRETVPPRIEQQHREFRVWDTRRSNPAMSVDVTGEIGQGHGQEIR
ncbi:LysR family transcriptional regulator [Burkholderia sp. WAC0059]|uniref:LysR family transcriptional regulator n=1 Tax=Burkholderia sp. WAC0059 TaxID=2066022 RepID=UPI000C7ECFA1|nr:LysR family transcriptional regulator [Burkholderia sp. WAC0059]PLZ00026.1 LysR family transcriptional regulator [Burkholderia sp. WAC0059]